MPRRLLVEVGEEDDDDDGVGMALDNAAMSFCESRRSLRPSKWNQGE